MSKWKIAIYLRLSKDDGDKDESDSISSQRSMITSYIDKYLYEDSSIVGEFIDDGFTGTNFNRPNFRKMINLVESKEINCIIVKDLSRFGRDYIGVGEYLEKYFPLHNIRFIAINDGYDTTNTSSNDEFIMPIKNIFNAQYSKDISKKVKSSFRTLQSNGQFVGAFACYGYKKSDKDRHKLVVDKTAAIIVKRIFDLFLSGQGKQKIAKILNDENIPCPSEYKRLNGLNYTNGNRLELTKYWTYSTINNILHNRMYIGDMVQNKTVRNIVRGRAKKNEKENWIIKESTHEPIIDKNIWNLAQSLLEKNTRQLDFQQNVGLFAGYIFCGDCNRAMSKIINKYKNKTVTTYICGTYKRYGSEVCNRNAIKMEELEELVLNKLNEQISKIDKLEISSKKNAFCNNEELKKYQLLLEKIYSKKKGVYEDYREGILTKEEYLSYKNDYSKDEERILGQINSLKEEKENTSNENEWIERLKKYKRIDKLNRELIAEILDKIVISKKDDGIEVKIIFKFSFL